MYKPNNKWKVYRAANHPQSCFFNFIIDNYRGVRGKNKNVYAYPRGMKYRLAYLNIAQRVYSL